MIGNIWQLIILNPLINILIVLAHVLFGNFGLAIIVITVIFNLLLYPFSRRQMKLTKAQQDMAPKLAEIRKKYAKDSQKLAEEQMKLYRELGISPIGCLLPMLIQMPIWFALYQSIMRVMVANPEGFANLSNYLYSWSVVYNALPLNSHFLWFNLATPDMLLALLVGVAMWLQQKMAAPLVADPQTQAQTQTMQLMMPIMFMFLSMTFPSGLALYWVVSNLFRIVLQYFYSGWGGLATTAESMKKLFSGRGKTPPQKYIKK
ncbi:MAG: YidC/Oxa1 family membrane protein insertase [Dehalococcoidia bacterium]|nr:YidC/Oxa1 family membrane protein insertase [Dehalococcoidia bacterium]